MPFGDSVVTTGTGDSDVTAQFNFAGLLQDYTVVNNSKAREHSATQGRWLSPDPAHSGWNGYVYANNNPVTMADPSGLDPCDETDSSDCSDTPQPPPNINDPCGNGGTGGCTGGGQAQNQYGPGFNGNGNSPSLANPCPSDTCIFKLVTLYLPPDAAFFTAVNSQLFYGGAANFPILMVPGETVNVTATLPSGPQTMTPANTGKGCNAKQAVSFIHTNQAAATTVAQQLNVPTQNVLGLSGIESTWGTSNAAIQANNFFGLHGGANAPFATGVWYTSGGVAMSSFPSYLASAQSFGAQYGSFVNGAVNPTAFAQALVKAGFNPGTVPLGNPNFVRDTAATINATAGRMQCP